MRSLALISGTALTRGRDADLLATIAPAAPEPVAPFAGTLGHAVSSLRRDDRDHDADTAHRRDDRDSDTSRPQPHAPSDEQRDVHGARADRDTRRSDARRSDDRHGDRPARPSTGAPQTQGRGTAAGARRAVDRRRAPGHASTTPDAPTPAPARHHVGDDTAPRVATTVTDDGGASAPDAAAARDPHAASAPGDTAVATAPSAPGAPDVANGSAAAVATSAAPAVPAIAAATAGVTHSIGAATAAPQEVSSADATSASTTRAPAAPEAGVVTGATTPAVPHPHGDDDTSSATAAVGHGIDAAKRHDLDAASPGPDQTRTRGEPAATPGGDATSTAAAAPSHDARHATRAIAPRDDRADGAPSDDTAATQRSDAHPAAIGPNAITAASRAPQHGRHDGAPDAHGRHATTVFAIDAHASHAAEGGDATDATSATDGAVATGAGKRTVIASGAPAPDANGSAGLTTSPDSVATPDAQATARFDASVAPSDRDAASAAPARPDATPPATARAQLAPPWAEHVADTLRLTTIRDGAEMRLRLDPPGLGHIDVRITLQHDGVHASIVAEHDTTRVLLTSQQHLLHEAFERNDVRLSGFSVDVGSHAGSGTADRDDTNTAAGQGDVAVAPTPVANAEPARAVSAAGTIGPGRVSLRV